MSVTLVEGFTSSEHPVQAVQGGHAVGFRHRGVVECGLHEVLERVALARLGHDRLTDVNDLGCLLAEAVEAEEAAGEVMVSKSGIYWQ